MLLAHMRGNAHPCAEGKGQRCPTRNNCSQRRLAKHGEPDAYEEPNDQSDEGDDNHVVNPVVTGRSIGRQERPSRVSTERRP